MPVGRTVSKLKEHLADIYRGFIRAGCLSSVSTVSPVLIIGDEANQASLNTEVAQGDESMTYGRLLELRQDCPHDPAVRRRRRIDEDAEVTNLFQGAAPVQPRHDTSPYRTRAGNAIWEVSVDSMCPFGRSR